MLGLSHPTKLFSNTRKAHKESLGFPNIQITPVSGTGRYRTEPVGSRPAVYQYSGRPQAFCVAGVFFCRQLLVCFMWFCLAGLKASMRTPGNPGQQGKIGVELFFCWRNFFRCFQDWMIASLGLRRCIAQFEALIGSADWLRLLWQAGDSNILRLDILIPIVFSCERHYVDTVLCKNCNPLFRQVFAGFCEASTFPRNVDLFARVAARYQMPVEPKSRSLPLERWHLKWAQVSCVQPPFCHPGLELAMLTEFSGYGRVRGMSPYQEVTWNCYSQNDVLYFLIFQVAKIGWP